ncbi:ethanolamine ammonia-lyase reactivating factor EutA, partial [bacterium]|nr:ethanolamine ammonia-lyase reactivating factor EutA [bacterium]
YGDLGPIYGEEIRKRLPSLGFPLEESSEQIRATVIGAGQYTIQLTSSTIFLSRPDVLPVWDRQVVAPRFEKDGLTPDSVAETIRRAYESQDLLEGDQKERLTALYIRWPLEPSYNSLHMLASGIASALVTRNDDPWVIVFDADIGGLVGSLLKHELGVVPDVVATDEIEVGDLDFIDIGQEIKNRQAVPVVVKSLVFG